MAAGRVKLRRRIALGAVGAALLVGGYFFWFRDSSLVSVDEVEVVGATAQVSKITDAVVMASAGMTTLHVDESKLAAAVAGFPTVRAIATDASPPHRLKVEIFERIAIGFIKDKGEKIPVSDDGLLIPGIEPAKGAPFPRVHAEVAANGRLDEAGAAQAEALAAAPPKLGGKIVSVSIDSEIGLVIELSDGLELRFGDLDRFDPKWRAVEVVRGDPEFGAPSYLDVSVPERPVTG